MYNIKRGVVFRLLDPFWLGGRFDWPQWFRINSPFVFYQHFGLFSSISLDQVPLNSLLVWRYHRPVHVTFLARASPTWHTETPAETRLTSWSTPKVVCIFLVFSLNFSGSFWHGPGRLFHSIRGEIKPTTFLLISLERETGKTSFKKSWHQGRWYWTRRDIIWKTCLH
jgi:hypothetical protein